MKCGNCMNSSTGSSASSEDNRGHTITFAGVVGKVGGGFKRQLTSESYQSFFKEAGDMDASYTMIEDGVPCVLAVISK